MTIIPRSDDETPSLEQPMEAPTVAEKADTATSPEDKRDSTMLRYATLLRLHGAEAQMIFSILRVLNKGMCHPPLSDEELRHISISATREAPKIPRAGDPLVGLGFADLEGLPTLMSSEIPPPQWTVPDFLPEGLTLLAGKNKMGKSWFALDLALAVSQGACALGTLPTSAGHVLYLSLEDSRRSLQDRVRLLLGQQPAPLAFTCANTWPPLHEGGLENLETWLKQTEQVRLIVIDTLARVRAPGSAQTYANDYATLTPLKQLAEKYHVTILLIHHLRKHSASDPMDEVSGSTGLTGASDCIMLLQRERGQPHATLTITGRDVRDQSHALAFDEDTAHWSITQPHPRPLSAERAAIIATLKEASRPLSPKEIAQALDKSSTYVCKTLHYMVKQGLLQPAQKGLYEVITPEETREREKEVMIGNDNLNEPVEGPEGITEP